MPGGGMNYLSLRSLDGKRCSEFYQKSLEYAQFLWVAGKPAQAILQLNRAWAADLPDDDPVLSRWVPPFAALAWMLAQRDEMQGGGFIGNPVRHFQHLATRVTGPRREVRSWRAWACFHIAESRLDSSVHPRDEYQIEREELCIPDTEETLTALHQHGWSGESNHARTALCFQP